LRRRSKITWKIPSPRSDINMSSPSMVDIKPQDIISMFDDVELKRPRRVRKRWIRLVRKLSDLKHR
jgi:hypothetical protein